MNPEDWDLKRVAGHLTMDGHDLVALAERFSTPLHVVSAPKLRTRCQQFLAAFRDYPARVHPHFSYKTNSVAGVLRQLHGQGLGAEVAGGYQLWLAQQLGVAPERILLAGANKSSEVLRSALEGRIGLIVVDNLSELGRLEKLAGATGVVAPIALRVCPDVAPRGMNPSAVSGLRRTPFGLDLASAELRTALERAACSSSLRLRGVHAHIGSGIHQIRAFRTVAERILTVYADAVRMGAEPDLIDLGGGLGTRLSREFTALEMFAYLGLGRLPRFGRPSPPNLVASYGEAVTEAVTLACQRLGIPVPDLVLEPGRFLVSDAQLLLLSVGAVRERPGVGRFALTDGGAMSVSLMFLSEYHAVLLANREAPIDGRTSVFGDVPTAMDVVYRNLPLPRLEVGDLLAVMDAGAYFTATATNILGPRPPVVMVDGPEVQLVRRREEYTDLAATEMVMTVRHPPA